MAILFNDLSKPKERPKKVFLKTRILTFIPLYTTQGPQELHDLWVSMSMVKKFSFHPPFKQLIEFTFKEIILALMYYTFTI